MTDPQLLLLSLDEPVDQSAAARHARLAARVDTAALQFALAKSMLRRRLARVPVPLPIGVSWCTACGGVAGVEGHNLRCSASGERSYRADSVAPRTLRVPARRRVGLLA